MSVSNVSKASGGFDVQRTEVEKTQNQEQKKVFNERKNDSENAPIAQEAQAKENTPLHDRKVLTVKNMMDFVSFGATKAFRHKNRKNFPEFFKALKGSREELQGKIGAAKKDLEGARKELKEKTDEAKKHPLLSKMAKSKLEAEIYTAEKNLELKANVKNSLEKDLKQLSDLWNKTDFDLGKDSKSALNVECFRKKIFEDFGQRDKFLTNKQMEENFGEGNLAANFATPERTLKIPKFLNSLSSIQGTVEDIQKKNLKGANVDELIECKKHVTSYQKEVGDIQNKYEAVKQDAKDIADNFEKGAYNVADAIELQKNDSGKWELKFTKPQTDQKGVLKNVNKAIEWSENHQNQVECKGKSVANVSQQIEVTKNALDSLAGELTNLIEKNPPKPKPPSLPPSPPKDYLPKTPLTLDLMRSGVKDVIDDIAKKLPKGSDEGIDQFLKENSLENLEKLSDHLDQLRKNVDKVKTGFTETTKTKDVEREIKRAESKIDGLKTTINALKEMKKDRMQQTTKSQ